MIGISTLSPPESHKWAVANSEVPDKMPPLKVASDLGLH